MDIEGLDAEDLGDAMEALDVAPLPLIVVEGSLADPVLSEDPPGNPLAVGGPHVEAPEVNIVTNSSFWDYMVHKYETN